MPYPYSMLEKEGKKKYNKEAAMEKAHRSRKRSRVEDNIISKSSIKENSLDIPHEIVHDILLRLPVKSLRRFKAVSKSWRVLISDPQFIKSHLNLANKGNYLQRYGYIDPFCTNFYKTPHYVSLTSMKSNETLKVKSVIKLDYPLKYPHDVDVLGSCNGMLLISTTICEGKTFLWNPSTGEYKKIRNKTRHPLYTQDRPFFISGLGYNSSLDEYKAVIVAHFTSPPCSPTADNFCYQEAHMFLITSSKTGSCSWKEVDRYSYDYDYNIFSSSMGLTLNGSPHWVVRHYAKGSYSANMIIIYFDVAEEKFMRLPQPKFLENTKFELAVLRGCLCIAHNHEGRSHVDIWAMTEYGVEDSWTKLFVIQRSVERLIPLGFTKNDDEILMEINNNELLIYNLKTRRANSIFSSEDRRLWFKVAAYVESLVSPRLVLWSRDKKKSNGRERVEKEKKKRRY